MSNRKSLEFLLIYLKLTGRSYTWKNWNQGKVLSEYPLKSRKKTVIYYCTHNTSNKRSEVAFRENRLMKMHALPFFRFFHQENSVLKNVSKIVSQVYPSIEIYHLLYKSPYYTNMETVSGSFNTFVGRCLRFEVKNLSMNMIVRRLTCVRNKLETCCTQTTVLIWNTCHIRDTKQRIDGSFSDILNDEHQNVLIK